MTNQDLVPETMELDGALLRRWTPDDTDVLHTAVLESFEHLHPWMPWATETPRFAVSQEYIDGSILRWSDGTAFEYGIFDLDGRTLLGTIGLHALSDPDALEIGYWLHVAHTGRGLMTKAAAALTDVALSLPGIERVEIHCDEANRPSAAVPSRLGYQMVEVRDHPPGPPAESGRRLIWVMRRDEDPAPDRP
jgi:RimJ/RimL family protein N-acetyltransferase